MLQRPVTTDMLAMDTPISVSLAPLAPGANAWSVTDAHLPTPWTGEVTLDNALPDHPRPRSKRNRWLNLNGLWQFAGASEGEAPPFGAYLGEEILVLYPTESTLSGIDRHEEHMWYHLMIEVPRSWHAGDNWMLLYFGAVDYEATLWVNGQRETKHTGSYGRFSTNITAALARSRLQEIIVSVTERTDAT